MQALLYSATAIYPLGTTQRHSNSPSLPLSLSLALFLPLSLSHHPPSASPSSSGHSRQYVSLTLANQRFTLDAQMKKKRGKSKHWYMERGLKKNILYFILFCGSCLYWAHINSSGPFMHFNSVALSRRSTYFICNPLYLEPEILACQGKWQERGRRGRKKERKKGRERERERRKKHKGTMWISKNIRELLCSWE